MKNLFVLTWIILTAASCTQLRDSNFNHQKFTRLKPIESSKEVSTSDITENKSEIPAEFAYENYVSDDTSGCDSIWLSNGEIYVCTILEETKESVTFTRCPPDSSEFKLDKTHVLEIKNNEISEGSSEKRDTTISEDPYTSDQKEQLADKGEAETNPNSYAEKWNRIFFIGLTIFLVGGILLLISLLLDLILFPAILILLTAWFFSVYLVAKSTKMSKQFLKKDVRGYSFKYTLAMLYLLSPLIAVAVTGIVIFIILLLWL